MKKIYFAIGALSALLLSGCTQQELDTPVGRTNVLTAVMEGEDQTKSDATDEGVFTWAKGDKIYVQTSTDGREGTLVGDGGSSSGNFQYTLIGDETETGYAVYPYNSGHSITDEGINVVLPETYELGETLRNTNAIMLACPEEAATADDQTKVSSYKFNHLAGVMRFNFNNVPAGVDRFELSLGGAKINGTFSVTEYDDIKTAAAEKDTEKTTALTFTALDENTDITLFVPVPVGTYTGATLAFYKGESKVWSYESQAENTVARRNLVKMPTVTVASSSGEIINYVNTPQALKDAILAGGSIVLTKTIELNVTSGTLTIPSGKEVIIDLNGFELITSSSTNSPATDDITVVGKLNISNGTIKSANTALYVNGGGLTLEDCAITATGKYTAVYAKGGTVEAEKVTADVVGTAFLSSGATMTLTDCNVTKTDGSTTAVTAMNNGTLTISGGSYTSKVNEDSHDESYVIGVKGGSTATINTIVSGGNGGVTVYEASKVDFKGGSYTGIKACGLYVNGGATVTGTSLCEFSGAEGDIVVGPEGGTIGETKYTKETKITQVSEPDELKSIITNGGNAVLTKKVELNVTSGSLTIPSDKEVIIDLNGFELITSSSTNSPATDDITVVGKLNISNGTIKSANTALYVNGGGLTLEDCAITATGKFTAVYAAGGTVEAEKVTADVVGTAFLSSGATMTLTDCNVTKTDGSTTAVTAMNNGTLTISGGSYTSKVNEDSHDESYVIGVKGGSTATINTIVSGGNGGVTVYEASKVDFKGGSYTGIKACGLYVNGGATVTGTSLCEFSGAEGDIVVGPEGGTVDNAK